MKEKIVILYHGHCRDGFSAAWAAWKKFGNRARYIPIEHQMPPPSGLVGKEIYMLDFTYPLRYTRELMKANTRVTAIDHHVSAERVTRLTNKYSYALHHSGAVLAWNYFHPKKKTPFFLQCVEDSDIWKWSIPKSKEILVYTDLFSMNFKEWSRIVRDLEISKRRKTYVEAGRIILRYYNQIVDDFVSKAEKVRFAGHTVYAVNVPGQFRSNVGHLLAKKLPPFAVLWREDDGKLRVSLRAHGSFDVSKIAARFGGGGHRAAAAFTLPFKASVPWKIIKK